MSAAKTAEERAATRVAYEERNRARRAAQKAANYQKNREARLAQMASRRANNREEARAYQLRYRAENRERRNEYNAAYSDAKRAGGTPEAKAEFLSGAPTLTSMRYCTSHARAFVPGGQGRSPGWEPFHIQVFHYARIWAKAFGCDGQLTMQECPCDICEAGR